VERRSVSEVESDIMLRLAQEIFQFRDSFPTESKVMMWNRFFGMGLKHWFMAESQCRGLLYAFGLGKYLIAFDKSYLKLNDSTFIGEHLR